MRRLVRGVNGVDQLLQQTADPQRPVPSRLARGQPSEGIPPALHIGEAGSHRWPRQAPLTGGRRGQHRRQPYGGEGARLRLQRAGLGVPRRSALGSAETMIHTGRGSSVMPTAPTSSSTSCDQDACGRSAGGSPAAEARPASPRARRGRTATRRRWSRRRRPGRRRITAGSHNRDDHCGDHRAERGVGPSTRTRDGPNTA
jgi:hypothetical protein